MRQNATEMRQNATEMRQNATEMRQNATEMRRKCEKMRQQRAPRAPFLERVAKWFSTVKGRTYERIVRA
jgi:uncharacterized protein YukE